MAPPLGYKPPLRKVLCRYCGAELERRTSFTRAACGPCHTKIHNKYKGDQMLANRRDARRYRIILHVLGWPDTEEGFREMLAEMKRSPMMFRRSPETLTARRDWKKEHLKREGVGLSRQGAST